MNSVAFFTREKLQTVSVNIDDPFSLHFQRQIGIKQVPSVLLVDLRGIPKMYFLEKNSTNSHEPIIQFVNNWDKGKVPKKYIKLPGELKGSVLPLTEDIFMKEVIENDKDVFVKFYAPWCGHCKKLAPIYEELSDKLKANKKLVIAEMDATINHVPSVVIKSYPTLYLYAKDKKDTPIQFNGENTVKGMEKFLRQNAGNALY
jgi:protein disulfide-isomerase-like protein